MDNYETVKYQEKTLYLQQDPYIAGDWGKEAYYSASAQDDEGNLYEVTWECIHPEGEDESQSCNWDVYEVRRVSHV